MQRPGRGRTCGHGTEFCDLRANVSSTFTNSLALVSMKPQPLARAHSRPSVALIFLSSFKSHLLPANILIGGTAPLSSRLSASMSIICRKCVRVSCREEGEVMS